MTVVLLPLLQWIFTDSDDIDESTVTIAQSEVDDYYDVNEVDAGTYLLKSRRNRNFYIPQALSIAYR